MAMSLLIFLPFIEMDTPSETSISWGRIISNALARIVLVLGCRSAIQAFRPLIETPHVSNQQMDS